MLKFKETIFNLHDIKCNHKYADIHPYSFHLECVLKQAELFIGLVADEGDKKLICYAAISHDTCEDARISYNELVELVKYGYLQSELNHNRLRTFPIEVADIVYAVTDEKGKNHGERKNDKYYKELSENKLAVFVKLSDIAANTLYSKLTGSTMYKKYKSEFGKFKEKCWVEEYAEFFNYVEGL